MNDTSPRCAGPGTACRLVQLETPGARPVWAILDAAGLRRFTGELTLASWPVVRAYFNDGEVYYAEREGDPSISDRLIEYGVVTPEQLAAGTVQLGAVAHLGRLFDRVPTIDRDAVELVLEVITGEVLGEIADHTVDGITIASYRHHPSGVSKWRRHPPSPTVDPEQIAAVRQIAAPSAPALLADAPVTEPVALAAPIQHAEVVDHGDVEPTEADHQLVAEYEQLMSAAARAQVGVDEPTEQIVVPEALLILEAPSFLANPTPPVIEQFPDPVPVPVPEPVAEFAPEPVIEFEPEPMAEFDQVVEPIAPGEAAAELHPEPSFVFEPAIRLEPVEELTPVAEFEPAFDVEPAVEVVAAEPPAPFRFEFDLNKVLAQVVLENDGLPMPVDADDEIDDSVRAAVREALAEIEAATRPPITDGLSPTAFEIALQSAPESAADIEPADAKVPWLPSRALHTPTRDDAGAAPTDAVEPPQAPPSDDTPSIGLRRLIGGGRKP